MCIILTCEKYVRPDYELVENCFAGNPDGAGIMWCENGVVNVAKGFTDPQALFAAIESVPMDSRLVIHMRIATSGGIDTGTCHPFPICNRMEAIHAANVECDAAVAHNGVIRWCPTEKGMSDTIYYVMNVINPLYRSQGMTKATLRRIKEQAPNNRFAVMTSDGEVHRLGVGWETVTKGIQASNSSWRWSSIWDRWGLNDTDDSWSSEWQDEWEDERPDLYLYSGHYYHELTPDEEDVLFDHFCHGCSSMATCMKYGPMCDDIFDQMEVVVDELIEAREEDEFALAV